MQNEQKSSFPFIIGVILLWTMFFLGFLVWWSLSSVLLRQGSYLSSIIVGFSIPIVYTFVAWVVSEKKGHYIKLLHFISFIILNILFLIALLLMGEPLGTEFSAWLGISFISAVMAIMQYPMAGLENYYTYRPVYSLGGMIFMPLFIFIAAILSNTPGPPFVERTILFSLSLIFFWLSAAWLASRKSQGEYIPNLEIQPLMPFRPDYILPGGVLFVKGVIMMGVGLMILIHPKLGLPNWNWWGFILAFWGIITLIPLRGVYKLVKGKRLRMLGKGGIGLKEELYKSLILFIGLNILLYGFVNAFFGTMPFLELGVTPEFNSLILNNPIPGLIGVSTFILSFIVLIFIRSYFKIKLLEGIEDSRQIIINQVLLYLGTLFLIISYVHLFYLPPIRGLGYIWIFPQENPVGFTVGLLLFLAGSILILGFRPFALKNEFHATIESMTGVIADSPEKIRVWVLKNRIKTLVEMPEKQRDEHVRLMMSGLNKLPDEKKNLMVKTQMDILSSGDSEMRMTMMQSMDKAMFGDK